MHIKISTPNILALFCILFLAGCTTTSPEEQLKADLDKYIECTIDASPCAVDFMNLEQVKFMGGKDAAVAAIKGTAEIVNISKLEVNSIGKIQDSGKLLSSVISTTVKMTINGEDMPSMQSSLLAESTDGGKHWTFSDQIKTSTESNDYADDKQTTDTAGKPQVDINKVIRLKVNQRMNTYTHKPIQVLNITSLQDNVIIQNVILNRGKCIVDSNPTINLGNGMAKLVHLPINLAFGESVAFDDRCGNLLEMEIQTNKGSGVWYFN